MQAIKLCSNKIKYWECGLAEVDLHSGPKMVVCVNCITALKLVYQLHIKCKHHVVLTNQQEFKCLVC